MRLLVQDGAGEQQEIRLLSTRDVPGRIIDREPGQIVLAGDGLLAVEPQDPGELLVKIGPDGTRLVLDEVERPADSNFAGYESLVVGPGGARVAVSEATYRSSGVDGRLSILDAASGDEVVAVDTDTGIAVVNWIDNDRLITQTTGDERSTLQIRDTETLEVRAELAGWDGFGATVAGDLVWGTASHDVLGPSRRVRSRPVAVLPSPTTGEVIALLEPIDVDAATAEKPLVTPREPRAITPDEVAARTVIESSSANGSGASSFIGDAVGLFAIALAGGGVVLWKLRSDRRPQPVHSED